MRPLRILTLGLVGLLCACRTTRDGSTTSDEVSAHSSDAIISHVSIALTEDLPEHTYRLTLPPVSPVEDFRVELTPVLPNHRPGMTSLDARLIPGEQLGTYSTFYYSEGEGAMALINPPISGLSPKPFLFGEPLILTFRGNRELAIVSNDSIQIGYRYWRAQSQPQEATPAKEIKGLKEKAGYQPYVIYAPKRTRHSSPTYYIELIPSKWMLVDCNIHVLNGKFDLDLDTKGVNLPYIFHSDGSTMSTRMGCPEETEENRLVRHMGIVVLRDAGEPVTVYLPKGFTLLYRIYAPDGQMRLLSESVDSE